MKIYISSPLNGESYTDAIKRFGNLQDFFMSNGFIVLNPMLAKNKLIYTNKEDPKITDAFINEQSNTNPLFNKHSIFMRDYWMVKESDIVYCDLNSYSNKKSEISIGCLMEIAWGYSLGKNVVTVINHLNSSHNHFFIHEASTTVFTNSADAKKYLATLGFETKAK